MCTNLMIKQGSDKIITARCLDFGKWLKPNIVKVARKDDRYGYIVVRQIPLWFSEVGTMATDYINGISK